MVNSEMKYSVIDLDLITGILWIFNISVLIIHEARCKLKQLGFFYLCYIDAQQNKIVAHGLFPTQAKELTYRVLGIISQLTGEMS